MKNDWRRVVFSQSWVALYSISLPPCQLQRQTFSSVNERNAPRLRGKFARQISRFLSFVHLLANRCTRSAKIVTCLSPLLHNLPSIDPRPSEWAEAKEEAFPFFSLRIKKGAKAQTHFPPSDVIVSNERERERRITKKKKVEKERWTKVGKSGAIYRRC